MKTALASLLACLATASLAFAAPSLAHLDYGLDLRDEIISARVVHNAVTYPVATTDAGGNPVTVQVPYNNYGGSWDSTTDASFIRFADLPNGIYAGNNARCAPFITHLLKAVYAWDWSDYSILDPVSQTYVNSQSPSPYLLVSAIKHQVGFAQRITKLADLRPGDIAALWNLSDDSSDHAMIIVNVNLASAIAYPNTHAKAIDSLKNTTLYEITVLDSSGTGHTIPAANTTSSTRTFSAAEIDTRYFTFGGVTQRWGGVGSGLMGLLVDNTTGEIRAHLWSLPTTLITKNSGNAWIDTVNKAHLQTSREFVIGRLPADLPSQAPTIGVNLTKTVN